MPLLYPSLGQYWTTNPMKVTYYLFFGNTGPSLKICLGFTMVWKRQLKWTMRSNLGLYNKNDDDLLMMEYGVAVVGCKEDPMEGEIQSCCQVSVCLSLMF
jgi:hypothetical protein